MPTDRDLEEAARTRTGNERTPLELVMLERDDTVNANTRPGEPHCQRLGAAPAIVPALARCPDGTGLAARRRRRRGDVPAETVVNTALATACIEACRACATACDFCSSSCLMEEDVHAMARCIALDADCSLLCMTAATLMARRSEVSARVCAVCADRCDDCAAECSRHPMPHCQACADACRRCAEECRRMTNGWPRPAAT